jgi:hypothetical protein
VRPGVGGLVGDRVGELRGVVDLSSQSGASRGGTSDFN